MLRATCFLLFLLSSPSVLADECEPPNEERDGKCLSPEALHERVQAERWGNASGVFAVGYTFGAIPFAGVTAHNADLALGYHPEGIPLLVGVGGSLGGYRFFDAPCSTVESGCSVGPTANGLLATWRVSAAFAPFDGPSKAPWSASLLNPFIGLELVGLHFANPERAACNTPLCGAGRRLPPASRVLPALVVGNVLFVEAQSFVGRLSITADERGPIVFLGVSLPGILLGILK